MSIRPKARALSIGSYERGGLERVFRAILKAPDYDDAALEAFQYFMEAHIRFDSDPIEGHGALSPSDDPRRNRYTALAGIPRPVTRMRP